MTETVKVVNLTGRTVEVNRGFLDASDQIGLANISLQSGF